MHCVQLLSILLVYNFYTYLIISSNELIDFCHRGSNVNIRLAGGAVELVNMNKLYKIYDFSVTDTTFKTFFPSLRFFHLLSVFIRVNFYNKSTIKLIVTPLTTFFHRAPEYHFTHIESDENAPNNTTTSLRQPNNTQSKACWNGLWRASNNIATILCST